MNDLVLIEDGIIPIYQGENGNIVNARELHEFLEVGKDFTTWIKDRIKKYGFKENEDYMSFTEIGEREIGATVRNEYVLTVDIAKEISMVQNNVKGSEARRYFISVEKKFKEITQSKYAPLSKELQAIFALDQKIMINDDRLTHLENNMTIDYGQQLTLQTLAKSKAITAMGGMDSPAYKNKSLKGKVFSAVYRTLKQYLQVNSYRNTATKDFEKAKKHVEDWKPQGDLLREIEVINNQIKLW